MGNYDFIIDDPYNAYVSYQGKIRHLLKVMAANENWKIINCDNMDITTISKLISEKIQKIFNNSKKEELK